LYVKEDIPFNPRQCRQIQHVIARTREDIIVTLENRFEFPVVAGKIDDIIIARGLAKEAPLDDASASGLMP
jgi:hypothetical protein